MTESRVICAVRKRKVILTPEEEVRQNLVHYLKEFLGFPIGFMSVEAQVKVNGMSKRADILIHADTGKPLMVIECKRRGVPLTQKTISQIAMYNYALQAPYLMLSNGDDNFVFHINLSEKSISPLSHVPRYEEL